MPIGGRPRCRRTARRVGGCGRPTTATPRSRSDRPRGCVEEQGPPASVKLRSAAPVLQPGQRACAEADRGKAGFQNGGVDHVTPHVPPRQPFQARTHVLLRVWRVATAEERGSHFAIGCDCPGSGSRLRLRPSLHLHLHLHLRLRLRLRLRSIAGSPSRSTAERQPRVCCWSGEQVSRRAGRGTWSIKPSSARNAGRSWSSGCRRAS